MLFISKEPFYLCEKDVMKSYLLSLCVILLAVNFPSFAQNTEADKNLDERVTNFLKEHKDKWHDLNVPYQDGQALYEIIIKNKYTSAVEIGTSTGHSTIWIAWALSKTGEIGRAHV